jgi:hypothetical protein
MKSETYMSAAEAVKYGVADKLVPTRKTTRKLVKKTPKPTKKNKSTKQKAKK